MTGQTHLIGGVASLTIPGTLLVLTSVPLTPDLVGIAGIAAIVGALLPDLDAKESQMKGFTLALNTAPGKKRKANAWEVSPFALPAQLLHLLLGHRTLTHSLLGLALWTALLAVPVGIVFSPAASVGFVFGYASHLFLDACTPHGVPLLYPNARRFHCLPRSLRVATLSAEENAVFIILSIPAFLVVIFSLAVVAR